MKRSPIAGFIASISLLCTTSIRGQEFPRAVDSRQGVRDYQYSLSILADRTPVYSREQIEEVFANEGVNARTANLLPLLFTESRRSTLERYTESKVPGIGLAATWRLLLLDDLGFGESREEANLCLGRLKIAIEQFVGVKPPAEWSTMIDELKLGGNNIFLPVVAQSTLRADASKLIRLKSEGKLTTPVPPGSRCKVLSSKYGEVVLRHSLRNGSPVIEAMLVAEEEAWHCEIEHSWSGISYYPNGNVYPALSNSNENLIVFFGFPDHFGFDMLEVKSGKRIASFNTSWPRLLE